MNPLSKEAILAMLAGAGHVNLKPHKNQQFGIGEKVQAWTIAGKPIHLHPKNRWEWFYLCQCKCGSQRLVRAYALATGGSLSCGCTARENLLALNTIHGFSTNKSRHKLVRVRGAIIRRCCNPKSNEYHLYGQRGISVCPEWLNSVEAFVKWGLENGWQEGLQIDRRDNNDGYSPDNCRFVTPAENCRNMRVNHWITAFGETKCLEDWGDDSRCAISRSTLWRRIALGWEPEKALVSPTHPGYSKRSRDKAALLVHLAMQEGAESATL